VVASRFDVFLENLDPTIGREIQKTRPCVVISPDEMNRHLRTVIVAPMTIRGREYPTRISCRFRRKAVQVALDQVRTVDTRRLVKRLGKLPPAAQRQVLEVLMEMFAA
jgi:mRNA interferase MazF